MRTVYPVLICICLLGALCGAAAAIPGDPSLSAEGRGKARILLEYMAIFQKALESLDIGALSSDTAPYDKNALEKATIERDRQIGLCKSRKDESMAEATYVACLIAAKRDFASAIALKDGGVIDALALTLNRIAKDTDAGTLTKDQARDLYEEFDEVHKLFFSYLSAFYDDQLEARLGADYKNRFIKSHESFGPAAPLTESQPPLDDGAQGPALEILTSARETCKNSTQPDQKKPYVDCILAAEQQFADAVKLRDRTWYKAFEAALQTALADFDRKKLTPAQFDTVTAWLTDAYSERINQQQSDYHLLVARPVALGYAVRFGAAFVAVSGNWVNDKVTPYDDGAMDQAVRNQREAAAKCQAEYNAAVSEAINLECYIATCRVFARAIKLKDANLLDTYVSALRGVAADTDAGRLTQWQKDAAYEALNRHFSGVYLNAADFYLAKFYRTAAKPYLLSFDNAYIAARGTKTDEESAPPWDLDAVPTAQRSYDQSARSCYDRSAEFKTKVALWECRAAAERTLAASIHRRDMLIVEKLLAALLQAAADADKGVISADQLKGVTAALSIAYNQLTEKAWRAWRTKQTQGAPQ
jgi:hypothetical protein